jgi:hypothetical protein
MLKKVDNEHRQWSKIPNDIIRAKFLKDGFKYTDTAPAEYEDAWIEVTMLQSTDLIPFSLGTLQKRWHWNSKGRVSRLLSDVESFMAASKRNANGTQTERAQNDTEHARDETERANASNSLKTQVSGTETVHNRTETERTRNASCACVSSRSKILDAEENNTEEEDQESTAVDAHADDKPFDVEAANAKASATLRENQERAEVPTPKVKVKSNRPRAPEIEEQFAAWYYKIVPGNNPWSTIGQAKKLLDVALVHRTMERVMAKDDIEGDPLRYFIGAIHKQVPNVVGGIKYVPTKPIAEMPPHECSNHDTLGLSAKGCYGCRKANRPYRWPGIKPTMMEI